MTFFSSAALRRSQCSEQSRGIPAAPPTKLFFFFCFLQIDDTGTFQVIMVPSGTDYAPALERLQRCTFCYGETHRENIIWSGLLSTLSHCWQDWLDLGSRGTSGLGKISLGLWGHFLILHGPQMEAPPAGLLPGILAGGLHSRPSTLLQLPGNSNNY